MRTLVGLFLVAHGLVTAGIWGPRIPVAPEGEVKPPDPSHSWILGDVRGFSLAFGVAVGFVLVIAGIGYLTEAAWWPPVAVGAGAASLLLFVTFFTPWWVAGIAISLALVVGALNAGDVG